MSRKGLEIRTEERDGNTFVYTLTGELHGTQEGYDFQDLVRNRISAGAAGIIIDIGKLERIDSSGIGILLGLMVSVCKAGGELIFTSMQPRIRALFEMIGLLDHFEQADSVEHALSMLDELRRAKKEK